MMKPVETGVRFNSPDESDAARMIVAAGLHDALELVSPYRFRAPLAPVVAAGLEGVSIEVEGSCRAILATGGAACVHGGRRRRRRPRSNGTGLDSA